MWYSLSISPSGEFIYATDNNNKQIYKYTNQSAQSELISSQKDYFLTRIASSNSESYIYVTVRRGYIYKLDALVDNRSMIYKKLALWTGISSSANGVYIYAVEETGHIHISNNYGLLNSWSVYSPIEGLWSSITSSITGEVVIAVDKLGTVVRSIDYGVTWESFSTSLKSKMLTSVAVTNDIYGLAFMTAYNNHIYTLQDLNRPTSSPTTIVPILNPVVSTLSPTESLTPTTVSYLTSSPTNIIPTTNCPTTTSPTSLFTNPTTINPSIRPSISPSSAPTTSPFISGVNLFTNIDFSIPVVATNLHQSFSGNYGGWYIFSSIINGQSAFNIKYPYPYGSQCAVLQNTNYIYQNVTLVQYRTYNLTWYASGRAYKYGSNTVEIRTKDTTSLVTTTLYSFKPPTNVWKSYYLTIAPTVTSEYLIYFVGTIPSSTGDASTALQHIQIVAVA